MAISPYNIWMFPGRLFFLFSFLLLFTACEESQRSAGANAVLQDPLVANSRGGQDFSRNLNEMMRGPTANYCPTCTESTTVTGTTRPSGSGANFLNQLKRYPKNCGFIFGRWNRNSLAQLDQAINDAVRGRPIQCHPSDCATASYLALIQRLRGTPHFSRLDFRRGGPLYRAFVIEANSIERTFSKNGGLGLGSFKKIQSNQIAQNAQQGWPATGDFVLLNRRNNSGHMTVFSHFENGNICYWSSNEGTRGMGVQCEPVSRLGSIHVGKVE